MFINAFNGQPLMNHERILAVHDISCVGRCSLTVALPIISAAGIECSGLPTAVLSTHTGGFKGFTYRDLTEDIVPIKDHWRSLDLRFDAFYTGFLGSFEQIDLVCDLFDELSHESTTIYVDPVMADEGKLYGVFGDDFPAGMRKLCKKADVIMPNLTELCLMLGLEWRPGPYAREYIDEMLEKAEAFGTRRIVLTGISFEKGLLGAVYKDYETGETGEVMRPEIPGYYHGTGDVFSSALVGACESRLPLHSAVEAAIDLTVGSIIDTYESGEDIRYGVNFEKNLRRYANAVYDGRRGFTMDPAVSDDDLRIISSMGFSIWNEAYSGIISPDQIFYMLKKYQSFEAIKEQIDEYRYTYLMLREGGTPVGYCGFAPDDKGLFLSKLYILDGFRRKGYSAKVFDHLDEVAKEKGLDRIYLTVNRDNSHAIDVYRHEGFEIAGEQDVPIGEGFVMNDYIMERPVRKQCSYRPRGRSWTALDGSHWTSSWCPATPIRTIPTTARPWWGIGSSITGSRSA